MKTRISQLDGLRGCCIIAVFLEHAVHARMFWIGVDVFFVLSGFLITGILLDMKQENLGTYFAHFYDRRVRRILPAYLLLLLVATLLLGTRWMSHWYMYFGLTNYLGFFPNGLFPQFDALWSLGVEEQFYLFWPLVLFFLPGRKVFWVAIALLLATPILRAILTPIVAHQPWNGYPWFIFRSTPTRMDDLAMGAILTFIWRAHGEKIQKYGYLGLLATVIVPVMMVSLGKLGGFSTFQSTLKANTITYELALITATGTFLWALGGRYTALLNIGPLRWLGRISYSLYLIHETALIVAQKYVHTTSQIAIVAATGSIAYAALSWKFLEKPILQGGNRRTAKREAEAAHLHPTR